MSREKELKKTLSAAIGEGLLSHAVLIEGEKGTGKWELAVWLAKAMLCKSPCAPCESCAVCRKISDGNHPDVEIYDGSGSARGFHIESIREIKNSLWLAPNEAEQKVYILLEIQNMTQEAQNALLKSLEEPPAHARFIMTCDNRHSLLDTIISRSTVYVLDPPGKDECSKELEKSFSSISSEEAELAAVAFAGNFGAAYDAVNGGKLDIIKLASKTPELLRKGKMYELASELSLLAPERAALSEYFDMLGNIVGRCGVDWAAGKKTLIRVTSAEAVGTMEIVRRGKEALFQNCSVELVQSWACMELARVFGGNL